MTNTIIRIVFLFALVLPLHLQAQVKTWSRLYSINPTRNGNDFPAGIVQATDGGYVLASTTNIYKNSNNVWITKLNKNGTFVWQKGYDTRGTDNASSIERTSDLGFIVVGSSFTRSFDAWILKIDSAGNTQWLKFFGGEGQDVFARVKELPDGGFIVSGETTATATSADKDIWVVRLTSSGETEWQKKYDSGGTDYGYSLALAPDGFILAGPNFSTMKLNGSGNIQWVKSYGGSKFDFASSIIQVPNGFLLAGSTVSFGKGDRNVWVVRIDLNGNIVWQKVFGESAVQDARAVVRTRDGGFIVAGNTDSTGSGGSDLLIIKFGPSGNVNWQRTYGGPLFDVANSIRPTADGGYIVSATTKSFGAMKKDIWVLKLNSEGLLGTCSNIVKTSFIPADVSTAVATNRSRVESDNTIAVLDREFVQPFAFGISRSTCQ